MCPHRYETKYDQVSYIVRRGIPPVDGNFTVKVYSVSHNQLSDESNTVEISGSKYRVYYKIDDCKKGYIILHSVL